MSETGIPPQRFGRRIAMSPAERDTFLTEERTCRVATVSASGVPHNTPLWYVWLDGALWLYSIVKSKRWANLAASPRVSVVVDTGTAFDELRGVELIGPAVAVGEQPRRGEPSDELAPVERAFAAKYNRGGGLAYDGRHAWLRVDPERQFSWDFRKIGW